MAVVHVLARPASGRPALTVEAVELIDAPDDAVAAAVQRSPPRPGWGLARPAGIDDSSLIAPEISSHQLAQLAKARALVRDFFARLPTYEMRPPEADNGVRINREGGGHISLTVRGLPRGEATAEMTFDFNVVDTCVHCGQRQSLHPRYPLGHLPWLKRATLPPRAPLPWVCRRARGHWLAGPRAWYGRATAARIAPRDRLGHRVLAQTGRPTAHRTSRGGQTVRAQ